jgi:hypothetical protein
VVSPSLYLTTTATALVRITSTPELQRRRGLQYQASRIAELIELDEADGKNYRGREDEAATRELDGGGLQ